MKGLETLNFLQGKDMLFLIIRLRFTVHVEFGNNLAYLYLSKDIDYSL